MNILPKTKRIRDASIWTVFLIILFIFLDPLIHGFPLKVLSWDAFGYYLYLPQTFIEGDIGLQDQEHINHILATYNPSDYIYQFHPLENGNRVIQYSSGVALMSLPFFFIGHFFAWALNYPMDGFSLPYVCMFLVGYYSYMILGIVLLRKVLLHFFNANVTSVVLVLICLGTNFYAINIASPGMSHIFLFPLYCGVILMTIKWYDSFRQKHLIALAALVALIVLVRPLDGMIILFPLLYNIHNFKSVKERALILYKYKKQILFGIVVAFLIGSIQMLYWYHISGHFFLNSYRNIEEGIFLNDPNLFRFLFSYLNGWLVYTPIFFLLIFGFILKHPSRKKWLLPISLLTILFVFISSCWTVWWYGSSFGQRTMIQIYPLLALPIGSLVYWVGNARWRIALFSPILVGLVALSVFQAHQFKIGTLPGNRMSKEYYWAIFGKLIVPPETRELQMVDRDYPFFVEEKHDFYKEIKLNSSFENEFYMDTSSIYSQVINFQFKEMTNDDYAWYKMEVDLFLPKWSNPEEVCITGRFFREDRPYGTRFFSIADQENYEPDKWFHATAMYITPIYRRKSDKFEGMIWNRNQKVHYKNFKVTSYVQK